MPLWNSETPGAWGDTGESSHPDHGHVRDGSPRVGPRWSYDMEVCPGRLTPVMAAGVMTILDWDTVEANIPSLFRGPVMITACGCPEKAATTTRRKWGGGPNWGARS